MSDRLEKLATDVRFIESEVTRLLNEFEKEYRVALILEVLYCPEDGPQVMCLVKFPGNAVPYTGESCDPSNKA